MKILFFVDVKGHLGDAVRINKIHEKLAATRVEVIVVNLNHYYAPRNKFACMPLIAVQVALNAITVPNNVKYVGYVKFCELIAKREIQKIKPDLVWCEGIVQGGAISQICTELKVPLVTDVHGLASAEYIENKFIKHAKVRFEYLKNLEQKALENSAYLTTVSRPMNEYFLKNGGRKEQLVYLPNGATLHLKLASYETPLKAIYGGIFAFWEDVDSFIDAAKLDPVHKYILAGAGPLKEHVEHRIENEKVPLTYLGRVPKEEIMNTFASAQVGIAPSVDAITRRVACPIKAFDYLACGLPVITPDFGEWATIIKENKCGIVTKESTGVAFKDALNELNDEATWSKYSKNAVSLIKNKWNWDVLLKPIEKVISKF